MGTHPYHENICSFITRILIVACKQKKQKHLTVVHNFYFLVLDYLESWLNLMIVSMFVLESRQVGDILSLNFPVYWVEIFQNVTQNLLFLKCVSFPTSFLSGEYENEIRFENIHT